uniref:Putative secreted protein n=1 Tax=Ixodes ricinus TaxID=34613 RepID=A0A6B0UBI6_IXORI
MYGPMLCLLTSPHEVRALHVPGNQVRVNWSICACALPIHVCKYDPRAPPSPSIGVRLGTATIGLWLPSAPQVSTMAAPRRRTRKHA